MKILDRLEEWIIILLMAGATSIVFVSVLHRYASGLSIPGVQDWLLSLNFGWTQELCIIMFVWMAKFGAAYGVRTGIHVGVDVMVNRLAANNRARVILFGLLAGALFTGIVATLGARFVWDNGAHHGVLGLFGLNTGGLPAGPTTPDLEWPTWIVYLAVPLGSTLMCFRFLQVAFAFYLTGALPQHDHGHVEGLAEEPLPVDVNVYDMDDNLHYRDLTHGPLGESDGPDASGREDGKP